MCIAIWARRDAQLQGLADLERWCRNTRQEIHILSERQETFKSTMEDKIELQSRANERYHDQIKALEKISQKKALHMVQKKHDLWRYQNESDEARMLQSSGNSRRLRKGLDLQHPTSSESCRSSMVDHDEDMTLEPPSKRQEVQEVMKETEWKARGRKEEAWRLEPEGETEVPETGIVEDGVEGTYVDLDGEGRHARGQVKNHTSQSGLLEEEGGEIEGS